MNEFRMPTFRRRRRPMYFMISMLNAYYRVILNTDDRCWYSSVSYMYFSPSTSTPSSHHLTNHLSLTSDAFPFTPNDHDE